MSPDVRVRKDGDLPGLPWTVSCLIPCKCRGTLHVADARMAWAVADMRSQRRPHREHREQQHTNPTTRNGEAA